MNQQSESPIQQISGECNQSLTLKRFLKMDTVKPHQETSSSSYNTSRLGQKRNAGLT
jgi:hypothetical protein